MNIALIQKLYQTYQTPPHVQAHMRQVAKVAVHVAQKIKRNGHKVDIEFVKHLALVHDLMKAIMFDPILQKKYPDTHDVIVTSKILQKSNEKKLAQAVLSQQYDATISTSHPLTTLEEIIVHYADKRVAHTEIVPLEYRFKEGSKRYGKRNKTIEKKIFELEKDLSCMAGEDLSYADFTLANA